MLLCGLITGLITLWIIRCTFLAFCLGKVHKTPLYMSLTQTCSISLPPQLSRDLWTYSRHQGYYLISIIVYLSASEWNEAPLSSAVAKLYMGMVLMSQLASVGLKSLKSKSMLYMVFVFGAKCGFQAKLQMLHMSAWWWLQCINFEPFCLDMQHLLQCMIMYNIQWLLEDCSMIITCIIWNVPGCFSLGKLHRKAYTYSFRHCQPSINLTSLSIRGPAYFLQGTTVI